MKRFLGCPHLTLVFKHVNILEFTKLQLCPTNLVEVEEGAPGATCDVQLLLGSAACSPPSPGLSWHNLQTGTRPAGWT